MILMLFEMLLENKHKDKRVETENLIKAKEQLGEWMIE